MGNAVPFELIYATSQNQPSESNPPCSVCIERKFTKSSICKELEILRYNTGNVIAVEKLCSKIAEDETLYKVAQKLNSYHTDDAKAFLNDILCLNNRQDAPDNSRSICNFVGNLTVGHIKAWKICKDARPNSAGLRLDWDILQSVEEYENNSNLKADLYIKNIDRFRKMLPSNANYVGECNTCKPSGSTACERLPYLHIYLNALKDFTTKYSSKTDFDKFITGEATAIGDLKQDGAYFLMKDLNNTNYLASNVVSFEGTIASKMPSTFTGTIICNDCSYDVEKGGNILVDYKSVGCSWSLSGKKIPQFKQYLQYWSATPPVRSFEYVFNSEKLSLQQAKQKFVALLKTDPKGFYNINPAFFNRIDRTDGSGFKVANSSEFVIELNKPNFWQNIIFEFVKITP